jgi:hypothetical protein
MKGRWRILCCRGILRNDHNRDQTQDTSDQMDPVPCTLYDVASFVPSWIGNFPTPYRCRLLLSVDQKFVGKESSTLLENCYWGFIMFNINMNRTSTQIERSIQSSFRPARRYHQPAEIESFIYAERCELLDHTAVISSSETPKAKASMLRLLHRRRRHHHHHRCHQGEEIVAALMTASHECIRRQDYVFLLDGQCYSLRMCHYPRQTC